jgi:hypothetical protein
MGSLPGLRRTTWHREIKRAARLFAGRTEQPRQELEGPTGPNLPDGTGDIMSPHLPPRDADRQASIGIERIACEIETLFTRVDLRRATLQKGGAAPIAAKCHVKHLATRRLWIKRPAGACRFWRQSENQCNKWSVPVAYWWKDFVGQVRLGKNGIISSLEYGRDSRRGRSVHAGCWAEVSSRPSLVFRSRCQRGALYCFRFFLGGLKRSAQGSHYMNVTNWHSSKGRLLCLIIASASKYRPWRFRSLS